MTCRVVRAAVVQVEQRVIAEHVNRVDGLIGRMHEQQEPRGYEREANAFFVKTIKV